jgi:glutathione synthase/RimK-type ligase-like ATP-grasp enzyme/ribosomal protein S18 acetylase RimI-like enzyme
MKANKFVVADADHLQNECFVREAEFSDIDFLEKLECTAFPEHRRSSRRSLRNSLMSDNQVVLVVVQSNGGGSNLPVGAAILIPYKRTIRIYSIAVCAEYRMKGYGESLLSRIIEKALQDGYTKLSLEADESNPALIEWYHKFGFDVTHYLQNYYGPGESAYRMTLLPSGDESFAARIVVVVEDYTHESLTMPGIAICSARDYLAEKKYSCSSRYHVLNFCKSYKTHSIGYYVSLVASARNHRITPSVMSVKDVSDRVIAQSIFEEMESFAAGRLKNYPGDTFETTVILGITPKGTYPALARKLFSLFELPFFNITLERRDRWKLKRISPVSFKTVQNNYTSVLCDALLSFCEKKRYFRTRLKNYQYDLAILVNPAEKTPPSCPDALKKFRKAAEKVGFFVEFITKQDHRRLCEFDALFIRETTAIESHTYAMARHAYTEGLVVVDDPWSILLCSNKVYLYERLANAGVPQPKGYVLTKKQCSPTFLATLPLPLVLKLPESSFSQGVFLVKKTCELKERLMQLFTDSALVIAQDFMVSDYDWRIGIMDNMPLFACKYFMANGHWQIYNWQSTDSSDFVGKSETIPVDQVPAFVLKAALKATSLIGNGLYGVDVKEVNGKAYVIEVNDNPNIDEGVEDLLLGDELYQRIMQSLFNRIEIERLQKRSLI